MAKETSKVNKREDGDSVVDHSSLRLPYGIAKSLGLKTDGMTPSQVWDMLNGYGMNPKEVYEAFYEQKKQEGQNEIQPVDLISDLIEEVEVDKEKKKDDPFESSAYSEERIKNALNSSDPKVFDQMARKPTYIVWKNLTEEQKSAVVDYTGNYSKFNEPLRGIEYGTSQFKGVGNIDMDNIGVSYKGFKKGEVKKKIEDLTYAIDQCSYDKDVIVRRGCYFEGMDKFFNGVSVTDLKTASTEKLTMLLTGKTFKDNGFVSCGSTKGKGFSKNIKFSIYAPKGTKMMYVEPVSQYGNGFGKSWAGQDQTSFSYEDETVIQRGTSFKVTEVKRLNDGNLYIRMQVVAQDKF